MTIPRYSYLSIPRSVDQSRFRYHAHARAKRQKHRRANTKYEMLEWHFLRRTTVSIYRLTVSKGKKDGVVKKGTLVQISREALVQNLSSFSPFFFPFFFLEKTIILRTISLWSRMLHDARSSRPRNEHPVRKPSRENATNASSRRVSTTPPPSFFSHPVWRFYQKKKKNRDTMTLLSAGKGLIILVANPSSKRKARETDRLACGMAKEKEKGEREREKSSVKRGRRWRSRGKTDTRQSWISLH